EALEEFRPHYPALDRVALRRRVERYLKRGTDGQWLVKRDLATREAPRSDHWALLAQVRCPVLLVWATEPHVQAESVERMRQTVAKCQVVRVDCRHNVPADRPHELAQAIAEFAGRAAQVTTASQRMRSPH
ncbi:MAG: alpha/beta hydrolase, partial [Chloroflexi bacterium]|nr:alpha/beta hydrolase [Chloroflexota bacterium]